LSAAQHGLSLVYKPFLTDSFSDPQDLEGLPDDIEEEPPSNSPEQDTSIQDTNIIEEHEGLHYINKEILSPGFETEKDLNPDFKNLVDSIIK
jgi:hypothetical protein